MSSTAELSEELVQLGLALGLLKLTDQADPASWELDSAFFANPGAALSGLVNDPAQREAAIDLALTLLGKATEDLALADLPEGQTWIPLAHEGADPAGTLYAVLDVTDAGVDMGVAGLVAGETGGARLAVSILVPLVRVGATTGVSLLPGAAGGDLRLSVAVDLPPPASGQDVSLDGVALTGVVPTAPGRDPTIGLRLRGLRLPSWPSPRDLEFLGDAEGLDAQFSELVIGLLRSRGASDPASAERLMNLLTLVGLGDTAVVPALPLADVLDQGPAAVRSWLSSIAEDPARLVAWLRELARLLGLSGVAAVTGLGTPLDPYKCCFAPSAEIEVCIYAIRTQIEGLTKLRVGLTATQTLAGSGVGAGATVPGAVRADAALCDVTLGGIPEVTWFPRVAIEALLGTAAAPLVDRAASGPIARLKVTSLALSAEAGADRDLQLRLEAVDVAVGDSTFPTLDLTSVEALTDSAGTIAGTALISALEDFLREGTSTRRSDALLALLGLRRPVSVPTASQWEPLPSVSEFFADPLGALARYYARLLAADDWGVMADEVAVLLRAVGVLPSSVSGAGSEALPWIVPLPASQGAPEVIGGRVELQIWHDGPASAPVLHAALRAQLAPVPVDGKELTLSISSEIGAVQLPTTGFGQPVLSFAEEHRVGVHLGDDLVAEQGGFRAAAQRISGELRWSASGGLRGAATITGASVSAGGVLTDLPDPFVLDLSRLPELPAAGAPEWEALARLLGARLAGTLDAEHPEDRWRALIAGLLGWLPSMGPLELPFDGGMDIDLDLPELGRSGWPALSLPALVNDPIAAVRAWLSELLSAAGGTDFSPLAAGFARALVGGDSGTRPLLVTPAGSGTHEDPWVLPMSADPAAPELLAWLDPAGPSLTGLDDVLGQLLPDELTGGGSPPTLERLVELLHRSAQFDPDLRDILHGREGFAAALGDLGRRALDGDGLVAVEDQAVTGDAAGAEILGASHLSAPAHLDPAVHLAGLDPARVIYVGAPLPGVKPWRGQPAGNDPRLLDVRESSLPAAASDLGAISGIGPWYVLVPSIADDAIGRLRDAVQAIAAASPGTLVLVAHSIAGHAARAVWAEGAAQGLFTVATPSTAAGLDIPHDVAAADSVRVLQALVDRIPTPGAVPQLAVLCDLLGTLAPALGDAVAGTDGVLRPSPFRLADFMPPAFPASTATAPPTAITVRLAADEEFRRSASALVREIAKQVRDKLPTSGRARPAATHLGLGLRASLPGREDAFAGPAGGVQVRSHLRVDVTRVRLRPGGTERATPRLAMTVVLRRDGGWLVGGPGPGSGADPIGARIRWAEIVIESDPVLGSATAKVHLHDAGLYGIPRQRVVIDEFSLDATARALLGALGMAVSPVPASGDVRNVLAIFEALGVISIDAAGTLTFQADDIERLVADTAGYLRLKLEDPAVREGLLQAVRRMLGPGPSGPGSSDHPSRALGPGLKLEVKAEDGAVTVRTTGDGIVVGNVLLVTGSVTVGPGLRARAEFGVAPHPVGAVAGGVQRLVVRFDTAATPVLGALLEAPLDVVLDGELELYPTPDPHRLGRHLMALAASELIVLATEQIRRTGIAIDPLLTALGLLSSRTPPRVRNPTGLFADPVAWLLDPAALGTAAAPQQVSPAKVVALVEAVCRLLNVPAASGRLPLPYGSEIAVGEDGGDLTVTASYRPQAIGAGGQVGGSVSLALRVGPGAAISSRVTAGIRRTAATGFASAAIELDAGTEVSLAVRLAPTAGGAEILLPVLPSGPGLGDLSRLGSAAAEYVLPLLLDELKGMGQHDSQLTTVANGVGALGAALELTDANGRFQIAELRLLAAAPAAELAARFRRNPTAVSNAIASIVRAVAGVPAAGTGLWAGVGGHVSADLSSTPSGDPHVTLAATGLTPVPHFAAAVSINASTSGLGASRAIVETMDPDAILPDSVDLFPFVLLRVGAGGAEDLERLELGLWLDPATATEREGIVLRVPFGGSISLVRRHATGGGTTDSADVAGAIPKLLEVVLVPLVAELALGQPAVSALLERPLGTSATPPSLASLLAQSKILAAGTAPYRLAGGLLNDLVPRALRALQAVGHELASVPAGPFEVELLEAPAATNTTRYGVGVTVTEPLAVPPVGGLAFSIEGDASWEPPLPHVDTNHLELWLGQLPDPGSGLPLGFTFNPGVVVRGLGVHVTGENGPLLDAGLHVDALTLDGAYERQASGFDHAGARLTLMGFALPVGSARDPSNPVAARVLDPGPAGGPGEPVAPRFNPQLQLFKHGLAPTALSLRADAGTGPWWLPVQRSFGPVYVEQVGLGVDSGPAGPRSLSVLLDGGVTLSGLALGLDDLELEIPWASAANPLTWRLDLAGLAVAFDAKGLAISGGLRKLTRNGGVEYAGMLSVRAGKLGLTAVGAFGEFPVPGTTERYTSMFGFAALAVPLGGPPAFFVLGLGGGIGLNRKLVIPEELTQITNFPLVAAMDPAGPLIRDPMGALTSLGTAFPPQRGAFWLAAGVRFTSFTVVESIAVLTVALGDGLEINLLGLSRMGLPSALKPLVQVELAMRARFSSREAVLSVQAQLTDNSWLINPSCRLSGGFAFVIWFRTGEFILTLGGYHHLYKRRAYDPVVPRLGISWAVSSALAIKGESYFALTGSCVMAGARIEAAFDGGFVGASFTAGIDAIVSWDPGFYDARAYISVSGRIEIVIDFGWFGKLRIRVSFSIGAEAHVWGPRLRGEAILDLDVARVVVPFGPSDQATGAEPLGWSAFHDKYLVAGDPTGETMSLAVTGGLLTPPSSPQREPDDGSAARPFRVLPEFALRSTTRMASTTVGSQTLAGPRLDLGPMRRVGVTSTHVVELRGPLPLTTLRTISPTPVRENVPEGVWRVLDANSVARGGVREAFTGADVQLVAKRGPEIAPSTADRVDERQAPLPPLPLQDDRDPGGSFGPAMEAAEQWAAGVDGLDPLTLAALYQRTPAATTTRCLGVKPGISSFALRTLEADRAAPPRLARITERLVAPTAPAVSVKEHVAAPEPAPAPPLVEPPQLAAVLRVRPRRSVPFAGRTTVSRWANRAPRRRPPTLAEARAHALPIAAHLHLTEPIPAPSASASTLVGSDPTRPFLRAGSTLEVRRGYASGWAAAARIARQEAELVQPAGTSLRSGDVHIWHLPYAAEDWQEDTAKRPSVTVAGSLSVRACVLDRVGGVLVDTTMDAGKVPVPVGASRIVVVGVGAPAGVSSSGLSGWHAGSSLVQAAPDAYLIPGGVLRTTAEGAVRARRAVGTAVVTGADAVRGFGLAHTTLQATTRCLIVVISALRADDLAATNLLLGIDGADVAADGAGEPEPPMLITSGARAHLLYTVAPTGGAVTVSVGRDASWGLDGVLGSPHPRELVADHLLERGLDGIDSAVAQGGPGAATLTWAGGTP